MSFSPGNFWRLTRSTIVCGAAFGTLVFAVNLQGAPFPTRAAKTAGTKSETKTEPRSKGNSAAPDETPTTTVKGMPKAALEEKIRLHYFNARWQDVFNDVAKTSGYELEVKDVPRGRYSRPDMRRYNLPEAVRILNEELQLQNFRIDISDNKLVVIDVHRTRVEYPRVAVKGPKERDGRVEETTAKTAPSSTETAKKTTQRPQANSAAVVQSSGVRNDDVEILKEIKPRGQIQPASGNRANRVLIAQAAFENELSNSKEGVVVPVRSAVERVSRQIYRPFAHRAELFDDGPSGLPGFHVLRKTAPSSMAAESAGNQTPERTIEFSVEIDAEQKLLRLYGRPAQTGSLAKLIQQLDTMTDAPGQATKLVSAQKGFAGNTAKLGAELQRIQAAPREKGVPLAQGRAVPLSEALGEGGRRVRGVAQEGAPAETQGLSDLVGNLRGDVAIDSLEDLDLLILRGNEKDVEQVLRVIEAIEQLAVGSAPEIHFFKLQHVSSESLTTLMNTVYERVSTLRKSATDSKTSVYVIAVGRPNGILVVAPGDMMDSVLDLAEQLDQPVDPRSEVQVFPLKFAVATQVVALVEDIYENRTALRSKVVISADTRTNSVVVQANPSELAEVTKLIQRIDRDEAKSVSQMKSVALRHSTAQEISDFLTKLLLSLVNPPAATSSTGVATGGTGQGPQQLRDPKAVVVEFLSNSATASRLIRSGLLSDVRINPDPRTNSLLIAAPEQSMPLLEELVRILDQPSSSVAEIKIFPLKNADAATSVELLQQLFPTRTAGQANVQLAGATDGAGSLVPLRLSTDSRTNSVIAVGGSDELRVVEAILLRLDDSDQRNRKTEVMRLRNTPAQSVATAIQQFLTSQRDLLQLDPDRFSTNEIINQEVIVTPEANSNSLIISATPKYFDDIRKLAIQLDREPAQVVIQALIVEVELGANDEFGVELGFQDSVLFKRSTIGTVTSVTSTTGGVTSTVANSAAGSPGFGFNNQPLGNNFLASNSKRVGGQGLSNFSLGRTNGDLGYGGLVLSASSEAVSVLVRALAARRNVHVLSRPQILALDEQAATIQVGQRVPIVTGITQGQNGQQNPQITQDQAGIILTVRPRISPEGQVVMEIAAEKSAYNGQTVALVGASTTAAAGTSINSPIKDITSAQTTVKVPDGQTIVVGGMITQNDETEERKVPYLGDIPIVGNLFRYDFHNHRRTELLIFMTPRIISCDSDFELIKQVETQRIQFFQAEAEAMHGPIFGMSPRSGEHCPPDKNCPPVIEGMIPPGPGPFEFESPNRLPIDSTTIEPQPYP